jgi:hypothetical protein
MRNYNIYITMKIYLQNKTCLHGAGLNPFLTFQMHWHLMLLLTYRAIWLKQ